MLTVGSLIAGYRIERVLGQGGMGAVYLVANPELPRREALKLLSTELSHDDGFRVRFTREAAVAARLEHPNIVSVYRRGETDDGQLWIAMQFIDGTDADNALQRGQMNPQRAVHIVNEVAKALDYAHHHNVIHRDVKPANFLLSGPAGPQERVWLADFGIARAFDDASITGTGEVMATLSYAAPEVIAGDPVGSRADQYSLGCALFRMLTGKAPFEGVGAQAAVMMAHLTKPPPRVSELAPWLPPALDQVLATALAKDPGQRFASCGDFAGAAKAALHHIPPIIASAAPQHGPFVRSRPSRRIKIVAALTGTVALVGASITAITWSSDRRGAIPDRPHTTTSRPATSPPPVAASALPDLLLSSDELRPIMGVQLQPEPLRDAMVDSRDQISLKECVSAASAIENAAYVGSGWSAVRAQDMAQQLDRVLQAVVAFPSLAAAQNLLLRQQIQWKGCANRPFNVLAQDGESQPWTFSQATINSGTMTITSTHDDRTRWCGRALSIRDNVIVDVKVCRSTSPPGAEAGDIADKIMTKVSA